MNKKLLVYFSYSGNTKIIVDKIKANCDVLELKPKIPYSTDYQSVVDEYQNNEIDKRVAELQKYDININDYNTVIIGTPVWWYSITPVIRTFLKENDLSNKNVILFATNAGWLGQTFKETKELCPNSNIIDEMNIVFDNHKIKNESEVNLWIEKINKL